MDITPKLQAHIDRGLLVLGPEQPDGSRAFSTQDQNVLHDVVAELTSQGYEMGLCPCDECQKGLAN